MQPSPPLHAILGVNSRILKFRVGVFAQGCLGHIYIDTVRDARVYIIIIIIINIVIYYALIIINYQTIMINNYIAMG